MSLVKAYEALASAGSTCRECGACIHCCEVLEQAEGVADGASRSLSVGAIARKFVDAMGASGADISDAAVAAEALRGVASLAAADADLVFTVRRCCMCASCTTHCPDQVDARAVFAAIRELFALAGVTSTKGFEMTQIDQEWHLFNVYRAVYGYYYTDLPHVEHAQEWESDLVFFPGCPLVSYGPDLTREVFGWLQQQGFNPVLAEECCGSPLKSPGFMDRADAYKANLVGSFTAAGIKRVVCVCPGCMEELESAEGAEDLEFIALPQLLVDAGVKVGEDKLRAYLTSELSQEPCTSGLSQGAAGTTPAEVGGAEQSPRVVVFDSCHDRAGRFGGPIRQLFDAGSLQEMKHHGANAICCGASGAVSLVDADICGRRAHRVMNEEAAVADILVANCPTCSYTFASQRRTDAQAGIAPEGPAVHANYLDLVFESRFDWETTFAQLEGMWSGEYGRWVCSVLL